jgi:hypothetical protein
VPLFLLLRERTCGPVLGRPVRRPRARLPYSPASCLGSKPILLPKPRRNHPDSAISVLRSRPRDARKRGRYSDSRSTNSGLLSGRSRFDSRRGHANEKPCIAVLSAPALIHRSRSGRCPLLPKQEASAPGAGKTVRKRKRGLVGGRFRKSSFALGPASAVLTPALPTNAEVTSPRGRPRERGRGRRARYTSGRESRGSRAGHTQPRARAAERPRPERLASAAYFADRRPSAAILAT